MGNDHVQLRTHVLVGMVVALCLAVHAADEVQGLKIKLGLWEVTTTVTANTEIPIPAGMLEKLTAEQRARIQDRIDARKAEPGKTTTGKKCLSWKQLQHGIPFGVDGKSCTRTEVTSTSSEADLRVKCLDRGIRSDGRIQIEVLNPETVKGSVRFSTGGNNPMDSVSSFSAKWISPSCSTPSSTH